MGKAIAVKDEAHWHEIRSKHVGGSEIASLFYAWLMPDGSERIQHIFEAAPAGATCLGCLSDYKSGYRLFMEKAGRVESDFVEHERVQAGKHMEPAIAAWAQEKWPDWKLRKVRRYIQHDTVKGWGASLDYEVVEPNKPPVELKNVDWLVFKQQWSGEGEVIFMPPLHINLQLQTQLGVQSAAEYGWVVASVGGNQLKRGRFQRHAATQDKIAEAVSAFWWHLAKGKDPDPQFADLDTVRALYAQNLHGEEAADLTEHADIDYWARRFRRWDRHRSKVEKKIEEIKAQIGLRLGNYVKGTTPTFKISWPSIEKPAQMIPARWQEEMTYRGRLFVTPLKKGVE